jgi:probable F420-dependent oxidoreductase
MDLGFFSMNTDLGLPPHVVAPELEQRGFASFWVGEHSHIPSSRATPYPAGGDLPEGYWHMYDPFVSLGMAAAVTTTLRLGTGVCLVLEHDILALAKTVATLDQLSGGRVDLGVGVGWNAEELANHRPDIPFRLRYRALREHIDALRTLWSQPEPSYSGRWVQIEPCWTEPKPIQQPGPPVLFGAAGRLGMQHSAEWADGWCPLDVAFRDVAKGIERFRTALGAAGREPGSVPITMFGMGDTSADDVRRFRDLGVSQVILGTAAGTARDRDSLLGALDRWAAIRDEVAA